MLAWQLNSSWDCARDRPVDDGVGCIRVPGSRLPRMRGGQRRPSISADSTSSLRRKRTSWRYEPDSASRGEFRKRSARAQNVSCLTAAADSCRERGWLLKNSLARNLQKFDRVRKLYKRFFSACWTFSITRFSAFFRKPDFFNSHRISQHLSACRHDERQYQWLFQLGVLGFRGDEDGDVGIGVFPERKEFVIRDACFGGVALQVIGARNF